MADEGGEKTEMPTAKKLRDARQKGQVCTSKDVVSTALLVVLMYLAALLATILVDDLEQLITFIGRASSEADVDGATRQAGVETYADGDILVVQGESLSSRLLSGRLLKGGAYTSRHDHRMVMALQVASLGTESPIVIDDEACVGKSFPEFKL